MTEQIQKQPKVQNEREEMENGTKSMRRDIGGKVGNKDRSNKDNEEGRHKKIFAWRD